ncbi:ATP-binding protein [Chitinophaga filiformis]|uniref:Histidine kinase-, DNA gyrase B-, and HSP90-like ATPase n=1 Tax=Chitinophaga filiformis TaxID=104663 RepID=A0A1G7GZL8_CHIFI|nr:ATP-binding protein [Chitinophaga filiformis]SDE93541.1 hypothetical protein SAMN04488121_101231 [Chitinophaga filiformis]
MELNKLGFQTNQGLHYPAVLGEVKKSGNTLQPLFEAFTNALEAIAQLKTDPTKEEVRLQIHYVSDLAQEKIMNKIVIQDTGIGFNDDEFRRFLTFKDDRKGYHNKGSGRIQLLHSFSTVQFDSIYQDGDKFKRRQFHLGKSKPFLKENAIVFLDSYSETVSVPRRTTLTLSHLLVEKDHSTFNMPLPGYKELLLHRYIQYFCAHRDKLPNIILEAYSDKLEETLTITKEDIPAEDSKREFALNYKIRREGEFQNIEKVENFTLHAFKIPKNKLSKNILALTSKGEIVEDDGFRLSLNSISADDHLENNRFLFLISSEYINNQDSNIRGQLNIPRRDTDATLFDEQEVIFLEDIEDTANSTVVNMYEQLSHKAEERYQRIADLKEMFLLDENYLFRLNISINDTEEDILKKVYREESKKAATIDAQLKNSIDQLEHLDPRTNDYDIRLGQIASMLSREIPHQNRAALTHYVARRRLVLEIFDKVLQRKLTVQNAKRNEDESLLHNLLFTQRTTSSDQSDLWVLNEDFVLFKGVSEMKLKDVTIDGQRIFKERFTTDEQRFIHANGQKRLDKRPDVLLFPAEEKCIILEFKTPDTDVTDHLADVFYYASLILNLTKSEFPFKTFYGYLIGETLEPLDMKFTDSDFVNAGHFNFSYRPFKRIVGEFKNFDGALYTEVLKYSTLLERATKRNETLINKLFEPSIENSDDDLPF